MRECSRARGRNRGKQIAALFIVWLFASGICFSLDVFAENIISVQAAEKTSDKTEEPALSKKKITISKGETATLTVSGDYDTISWKVNRKSVAKLTKKNAAKVVVKGVKKGTTTVIATIDGVAYKCTVVVEEPVLDDVKITGIAGETGKLSVSGTKRPVRFYSKNKSVVTAGLTTGKLTFRKEGDAVVYAKIGNKKYTCNVSVKADRFWDSIGYDGERTTEQQRLAKKANQVYNEIVDESMPDIEKLWAIHDYIVENTAYDYQSYQNNSIPYASFTPEGVLLHGTAVCQGYAETMRLFLDAAGIENQLITGTGNGESHAWNLVKLDDGWYHVDATWDDPVSEGGDAGMLLYEYFCVPDSRMDDDHDWKREDYPEAAGGKYSTYVSDLQLAEYREKHMVFDTPSAYETELFARVAAGEKDIRLLYPAEEIPNYATLIQSVANTCHSRVWYYQPERIGDYWLFRIVIE